MGGTGGRHSHGGPGKRYVIDTRFVEVGQRSNEVRDTDTWDSAADIINRSKVLFIAMHGQLWERRSVLTVRENIEHKRFQAINIHPLTCNTWCCIA